MLNRKKRENQRGRQVVGEVYIITQNRTEAGIKGVIESLKNNTSLEENEIRAEILMEGVEQILNEFTEAMKRARKINQMA